MSRTFRLAWRYVTYHRFKSLVLVGCITLTAFLPIALSILLDQFHQRITARADSTPLVVGARGSRLDLTLHALYFRTQPPSTLRYGETRTVAADRLSGAIPIYAEFKADGFPIVGTTLEYFDFRNLRVRGGQTLARLGDCVVGAAVARRLGLQAGDQLLSDRENVLDLGGLYPLKMNVVGVLQPAYTPDDLAVFVDLKTAWVIKGLGHGHQDVAEESDQLKILSRQGSKTVVSPAVLPYTEITDENLASFHFHGEMDDFPLTAILALPSDAKSATILLGRYQREDATAQMVIPREEVQHLMAMVFQVKKFFDANAVLIGLSTLALLSLVILLSRRLREREMETMFRLGCSRATMFWLQAWELALIGAAALLLVAVLVAGTAAAAGELVQSLLISA